LVERVEEIYQALLNAGISEDEINQQIKEKESDFQGFMTKQAILYLIAKDHGINVDSTEDIEILKHITEDIIDYNDFTIPISEVTENMRNVVITGRILTFSEIKSFIRKDGTPGTVGSFQICDQSECIKIVLWNDQTKILESKIFQKGEIVQVIAGYSKLGIDNKLEIHLSRQGKIVLAPKGAILPELERYEQQNLSEKKMTNQHSNFKIEELHKKQGFIRLVQGIVQIDEFKELTLKNGDKSFLLKLILSDETASIKINIWGMNAVNCMKIINDGDGVRLSNVLLKENSYSNERELNFTKSSRLQVI
jgi:replication factor A1